MPIQEKLAVIAYLKEHPDSTAKEIYKGCGMDPKLHSAALYSMKTTGLVIAKYNLDSAYPRYSINPEADPKELENPRLIYKRARGPQKNHRIGSVEQLVYDALSAEFVPVSDVCIKVTELAGKEVRWAYVRKLLNRLEEINMAERQGELDKSALWRKRV